LPLPLLVLQQRRLGPAVAAWPIESIIAELQAIEAMDFAEVFFQDDTLNANPEWTIQLFRAIREAGLGLEYKVEFRANTRLLPKRLLEAAREAGVREIFFGVESGNDAIREAAGKNLPRKDILRAVRAAREHGIATLCAFIVGLPGETAETVQETLRFARELDPDSAGFSVATPFPGTELRAQAVREGLLLSDGYEALTLGVPVMRTQALTCAEVAELREEAGRQWAAHVRSRSPDAERRIRSLEEGSCREALALATVRDDGVGQAIVGARLARIRLDGGDNAEAIELSVGPLSEPALGAYDLAKAGVVLAIALRREGLLREAAMALRKIGAISHPAHREWIAREWKELAAKAGQTGVPETELAERLSQFGYKSYADYVRAERAWDPRVFGDWQISYGEMMDTVFEIGGKPVLDIGCSAGALTYSFHLRKADVRGCDIDKESIAISPFPDLKGRLVAMDTNRLLERFDPGGFRLVHSQQVFEHFPSWEYATEVVHAVHELLTPGSFFYCSLVWGGNLLPEELRKRRAAGESVDITHVNIQPRERWEKLFAKEGFVDVGEWLSPILKCYQTPAGFSYYQEYHWHQFFLMKPGQFDVAACARQRLAALLERQEPYARTEVYREVLNEPDVHPEMLDMIRGYTTLSGPGRICGDALSPVWSGALSLI